ncbi:hypothetical protein ESCO_006053 [Escovopsis weberi]|uniref:Serine/threonine-protein kinase ppk6 n=1 Tax=Escovopsis weberi TaxID=150374 RepID=A0A0M9VRX9_ESCWE|nr:hypothetical protein ESCO_006053 [Escovopsis weberi]
MTNTLVDLGPADVEPRLAPAVAAAPEPEPKSRFPYKFSMKSAKKPAKQQSSVLFDADDFELQGGDDADEDDDEFGDFAAGLRANPPSRSHAAPLVDLLSLDDPLPQPQPPKPRNQDLSQIWGGLSFGATSSRLANESKGPSLHRHTSSLAGLEFNMTSPAAPTAAAAAATASSLSSFAFGTEKKKKHESSKSVSSIAVWPSASQDTKKTARLEEKKADDDDDEDEDGWGAWDDIPSVEPSALTDVKSAGAFDHWNWNAGASQADSAILNDKDPPPTNIPPPSVILSMFPDLLASGNAFLQSMSRQNAAVKQKVLSSPETAKFIEGYILLATTAARVVAGRKHRWHRDKILAKSMSISAAGSKGMKLAGVDKTQSAKEDREVADVVAVWQEQVGRLRSAVTAANAAGQTGLKVPELREGMQVSTAKMVPTSPKACIVCGLKRDERISKVDYEVEDSFGEWWAEHWGHRSCKNFWTEHERRIRQR